MLLITQLGAVDIVTAFSNLPSEITIMVKASSRWKMASTNKRTAFPGRIEQETKYPDGM
jgi:hypothetical protein